MDNDAGIVSFEIWLSVNGQQYDEIYSTIQVSNIQVINSSKYMFCYTLNSIHRIYVCSVRMPAQKFVLLKKMTVFSINMFFCSDPYDRVPLANVKSLLWNMKI